MIFANEKRTGEQLAKKLAQYGFKLGILSGDIRQKKRMRILENFTKGELQLLVATDVASRGLHIDDVTHVFNYDLPEDAENYVHRIGRTARAGQSGMAISFACERFCFGLPDIEAYISHSIPIKAVTEDLLAIGKVTHPEAIAEGMRHDDRETKHQEQAQKPRRRRPRAKRA